MSPSPKGEPLFSQGLREWVESEFDNGRGRNLKSVK